MKALVLTLPLVVLFCACGASTLAVQEQKETPGLQSCPCPGPDLPSPSATEEFGVKAEESRGCSLDRLLVERWLAGEVSPSAELREAWRWLDVSWQRAMLDEDSAAEWMAIVRPEGEPDPQLWIVGLDGRVLRHSACLGATNCELVGLGDLDGDGRVEVVVDSRSSGAHTELSSFRVYHRDSERSVVASATEPTDAIVMENASAELRDANDDGISDLAVTGGRVGSAGAGQYQRGRVELWSWSGGALRLLRSEKESSDLRVFALYDALDADGAGDFASARAGYERVLSDDSLRDVDNLSAQPTRAACRELAVARLARLDMLEADAEAVAARLRWFAQNAPESALHRAFQEGIATWNESRDATAACQLVASRLASDNGVWPLADMGYANPKLGPESVCP